MRGEVWWYDFGRPTDEGHAAGGRRPVLVVSADAFNLAGIGTVIVAVITTSPKSPGRPGIVALASGTGGLEVDSWVNLTQLSTVDLDDFVGIDHFIGELPADVMAKVDFAIAQVFSLKPRWGSH